MEDNAISGAILDAAIKIHRDLGPGLLESVYEIVLANELELRGLSVVRQLKVPIKYNGIEFEEGFRADIVVNQRVVIELKSVEELTAVHHKQLLTYLRLLNLPLGILLNFNTPLIKDGFKRIVNNLPEKLCASA